MIRHFALGLLAAVALPLDAATPAVRELRVESFNRVYTDLVGELAPLAFDPVTVRLRSPRQTVSVLRHVARLVPLGDGRVSGSLEIELLGKGDLVADLDLAGHGSRLADELILPRQRIVVEGVVRIARGADGYRIVAERLPERVPVEIRSRLIDQVVTACEGAALLSLGSIDCDPVARALERPSVPLPAAGELFLADGELSEAARGALDALLALP